MFHFHYFATRKGRPVGTTCLADGSRAVLFGLRLDADLDFKERKMGRLGMQRVVNTTSASSRSTDHH
jgi:hypothetical protein